jgi:hypothetical protein
MCTQFVLQIGAHLSALETKLLPKNSVSEAMTILVQTSLLRTSVASSPRSLSAIADLSRCMIWWHPLHIFIQVSALFPILVYYIICSKLLTNFLPQIQSLLVTPTNGTKSPRFYRINSPFIDLTQGPAFIIIQQGLFTGRAAKPK